MAGLGIAIWTALRAACGIGKAVENKQMKDFSYKIDEKGRPTWIDREGNRYINGEKVIAKYDYTNQKLVYAGKNTGTVYIDPEKNQRDRLDGWGEERRQNAIKNGFLIYRKYNHDWEKEISTEVSTGRPIAAIRKESDGTYWKYYAREDKPRYKGEVYLGFEHQIDEPVQITEEEFDKIKIHEWNGTFIVY